MKQEMKVAIALAALRSALKDRASKVEGNEADEAFEQGMIDAYYLAVRSIIKGAGLSFPTNHDWITAVQIIEHS